MNARLPYRNILLYVSVVIAITAVLYFSANYGYFSFASLPSEAYQAAVTRASAPFIYSFNSDGKLREAHSAEYSTSPYFWLNSGGELIIEKGIGKTIQGKLPALHRFRLAYLLSSGTDTQDGYEPQNLFRLLTRTSYEDISATALFKINRDNLLESPNRNESNGLFFMLRYQDGDNLYYAGIRVDGTAVIKKKAGGTYYTLAQKKIFEGAYDRNTSPNLLPHEAWIGMEGKVRTEKTGEVRLSLSLLEKGMWKEMLSAVDKGEMGGAALVAPGPVGIRTDFMDIEFDSLKIEPW